MQRVRLNADRNMGFSATVSARALNVDGTSLAVFSTKMELGPNARELTAASGQSYDIDHRRRGNVIARPEIKRQLRQFIKLDELAPCVGLGEASAHGAIFYRFAKPAKVKKNRRFLAIL